MKRAPQFAPKKNDFIQFDGGLDQETPPVLIPPGFLRQAQNYEGGVNGGYKVVTGYERFDGRSKPSDATYAILNATITGVYAVGNTLTGVTSGATGVIAMVAASTYFVLTKVTGTFVVGENLQIAAVTVAVSGGAQITDGASNAKLHAQYRNAAADIYRASITAVPGSGPVRGVWRYGDITYAVRDNAGATAAVLFKSSSSGWTAVTMMEEVAFTNANTSVNEGDTLTQGGVTATVQRVAVQTGTLASGVNTGRLIISGRGGGNFAAGAATSTGGGALNLSGAQTAITLTAGGRYEVDIANFTGSTTTRRVYGASGVQRGFEFDGTIYAPITTGMSPDTPNFVKEHKKQLFFAFGASVQNSGLGFPFLWTPISGASEIAQGDTVTGFMVQPGSTQGTGALAVISRNKTSVLYGSSSADFSLTTYSEEQGALAYSIQRVGNNTIMLDDRGVTTLATTANYGNFLSATLTQRIQRLLAQLRTKTKASCVARDKNQYRVFFTDKSALYFTFNGNKLRSITTQALQHDVQCIHSAEDSDGSEQIFFGSSDGFVYQMEKGTSFDGQDIEAFIYLAFNSSRTPRQLKHYQHGVFEVAGAGYAEFSFRYDLGYASADIPQPDFQTGVTNFSAPNWDTAVFDNFTWDGSTLAPQEFDMPGDAENISLIVYSKSDYFAPLSFSGAFLEYKARRSLR